MGQLFEIIFRGKDEIDEEQLAKDFEFEARLRNIRRRIEKLRAEYYPSQRRTVPRPERVEKPVQDVGRSKEDEMNDLKNKLMRRNNVT